MAEKLITPEISLYDYTINDLYLEYDTFLLELKQAIEDRKSTLLKSYGCDEQLPDVCELYDPFADINDFYISWARQVLNIDELVATNTINSTEYTNIDPNTYRAVFILKSGEIKEAFIKAQHCIKNGKFNYTVALGFYDTFNAYGQIDKTTPKRFKAQRYLNEEQIFCIKKDLIDTIQKAKELLTFLQIIQDLEVYENTY
jgi:hypothetical protein